MTTANKPNLIWKDESEPHSFYREGLKTYRMPPAEEQRKGFYHEDPKRIKSLSAGKIKDFIQLADVKKGGK